MQPAKDASELEKWFQRNPQYRKSNGNFLFKKLKQEWSIPHPIAFNERAGNLSNAKNRQLKSGAPKTATINRKRKESVNRWTQARKERETIRRSIIAYLTSKNVEKIDDGSPEILNQSERIILCYRHFIEFGADASNVAPIDRHVHNQILKFTPNHKKWGDITKELMNEIESEYGLAVRKSIVDFALQDTGHLRRVESFNYFTRSKMFGNELKCEAYVKRFRLNRNLIKTNLYSINPCIAQMSKIWQKNYGHLYFVSPKRFTEHNEPFDLTPFLNEAIHQIEYIRNELNKNWYEQLRYTFNRGMQKKHTPDISRPRTLVRFFSCISALMTKNLEDICTRSMEQFSDFFCNNDKPIVCIRLHVLLAAANDIVFNPSFEEIEKQILRIIDRMIEAVNQFPRLETKIYLDNLNADKTVLSPYISPEKIAACKQRICDFLEQQKIAPNNSLNDFNTFDDLMNHKSADDIHNFIETRPNFDASCRMVEDYQSIENQLCENLWAVNVLGLYEFNREHLIETLQILARFMQNKIISKMVAEQQNEMKNLHQEYTQIRQRVLSVPLSTADLMELGQFLIECETTILPQMRQIIQKNAVEFLWLMNKQIYTPVERKQNTMAIQSYLEMPQVLDGCRELMSAKEIKFKAILKLKTERLCADLLNYAEELVQVNL